MSIHDHSLEAAKAVPPITASTLIIFGYPLNDWILIGSGVLIVLQLVFLLRDKLYYPWRDRNVPK